MHVVVHALLYMYRVHAVLIRRISYYCYCYYVRVPRVCTLVIGNRIRRQTIVRVINMRATATAVLAHTPLSHVSVSPLPTPSTGSSISFTPDGCTLHLGMSMCGKLPLRVDVYHVCVCARTPLVLNHCSPLPYTCATRRRHHAEDDPEVNRNAPASGTARTGKAKPQNVNRVL